MVVEVGVIGAGVVGLSTALRVQQQFRDVNVTLVAHHFGSDTTSDGAAGIFRPGTSFSVGSEEITKKVILDSYQEYKDILQQHPSELTGVSEISGYIFSNTSPSLTRNSLIEDVVPEYRPATEEELKLCPGSWNYGSYFTTILTECRRLLPYYMHRFQENGKVIQMKVKSSSDVTNLPFDVTFHCTGLGAKEIFGDRKLVPIRGQVLKVSAPWLKNFFYSDYDTYIIPGLDAVTLGGCRNYDSYDLAPSPHDTAAILERCCALVPKLANSQVTRTWVGLRPHRDPVRIEAETVNVNGKSMKIIHNYGHGGYGVTSAPGCAIQAVDLLKENHRRVSKL